MSCLKTFPAQGQGLAPGQGPVPGRCLLFAAACRALYWLAQVLIIHLPHPAHIHTPSHHPLNPPTQPTLPYLLQDDKNLACMRDDSFSSPPLVDLLVAQLKGLGLVAAQGRGGTDFVGGTGLGLGAGTRVGVGSVRAAEEGLVLLAALLGATETGVYDAPPSTPPPSVRMDLGSTADMVMIPSSQTNTPSHQKKNQQTTFYTTFPVNTLHSFLSNRTPLNCTPHYHSPPPPLLPPSPLHSSSPHSRPSGDVLFVHLRP